MPPSSHVRGDHALRSFLTRVDYLDGFVKRDNIYVPASVVNDDEGVMWDAPLAALPLSTSTNSATLTALLAAMGITLSRATPATVRVSPTALVTSGIGNNAPRVGDGGYGRGLVVEEARSGYMPDSENQSGYGVASGAPTVDANNLVAPDGSTTGDTVTDDSAVAYESTGRSAAVAADTSSYVVRLFIRKQVAATAQVGINCGLTGGTTVAKSPRFNAQTGVGNADVASVEDWGDWWRVTSTVITNNGTNTSAYVHVYPSSTALGGGDNVASTGSVGVWGIEFIKAGFLTEYIPTTAVAATRAADLLTTPTANLVRNDRVAVELTFIPKYAKAAGPGTTDVLYLGGGGWPNNTVLFGANNVVVRVGASIVYNEIGLDWSSYEPVTLWLEYGGNAPLRCAYRRGAGAPIKLPDGPTVASLGSIAATTSLISQSSPLSSWFQRVRSFVPGRRPAWVP